MNSNSNTEISLLKNMKTTNQSNLAGDSKPRALRRRCSFILALSFALPVATNATAGAATTGRVYATPEEAVAELKVATSNADTNAIRVIFGPAVDNLENPDRVQAKTDLAKFSAALIATNHLVHVSDTKVVLEIGSDLWPFPIPLIKVSGGWVFDTEAGHEELINRRIGRNELEVLASMRAYVDAQREYASRDRDGFRVLKYAQKIKSSPGKTDGLYWPIELNGEMSPLGPMVAQAQEAGYFGKKGPGKDEPEPFHGYFFKILTRQGKYAPGGKYDYVINGNMIGGFAMVAWPAEYGESGIMTFIVNQEGRVFQKDLGPHTSRIAEKMKAYDPDPTWRESRD
jgi:hypothetical protein